MFVIAYCIIVYFQGWLCVCVYLIILHTKPQEKIHELYIGVVVYEEKPNDINIIITDVHTVCVILVDKPTT